MPFDPFLFAIIFLLVGVAFVAFLAALVCFAD